MEDVREVLVQWHCLNGVGAPRWFGTEVCEAEECDTEFVDVADIECIDEGLATATCPRCRAELSSAYDHAEVVPGPVHYEDRC